ncbi:hypothetical protein QML16_29670, partial [Klebsiella pneumoniae]
MSHKLSIHLFSLLLPLYSKGFFYNLKIRTPHKNKKKNPQKKKKKNHQKKQQKKKKKKIKKKKT